ncbi:MAG: PEGA domain-containing protein [Pseudomonadota bacterium]
MTRKSGLFIMAFCLICTVSLPAFGESIKTTVLGFNVDPGAETFSETFTAELRAAVEARENLGHTGKTQDLEQLALAFGCPETPDMACLKEIGGGLDSTHLLYGEVRKASEKPPYSFQVTTHLFLTSTGKISKSTELLIPHDKQGTVYLQEGADRIVAELFSESPSTTIIVQSNVPGATILLDNNKAGVTGPDPIWLRDIEPGKHRVVVKKKGYKLFEKKINIKEGKRVDIDAPLLREEETGPGEIVPLEGSKAKKKKDSKWKLYTGVALTITGLGLAGGGIYYSVKTNSYSDDLGDARQMTMPDQNVCSCFKAGLDAQTLEDCFGGGSAPTEAQRDEVMGICDKESGLTTGQAAMYAVGAVVGGVGLYFLIDHLIHRPEKKQTEEGYIEVSKKPDIHVVPSIGPTSGGLAISGSF